MNVFETCFPKKRSDIYLPEDDVDLDDQPNVSRLCCCFNFRGSNKQGLIRLPTNNRNQRTIDDYLDPRSPVSIEVLLQEQEEELDHYFGQTDDEDAYHGPPNKSNKKFGPLDLNFETTNSSFFEEEDAQFLSEHRISAILVDRPKLSGAHLFKEDTHVMEQELLDVVVPTKSTSTGSISSRRFAFRKVESTEGEEGEQVMKATEITQIPSPSASSPQELTSITNKPNLYTTSLSASSSTSTTTSVSLPSITNTSVQSTEQQQQQQQQQLVNGKANESSSQLVSPVNTVGLSDIKIPISAQKQVNEFPATTLTRVPYQPLPPLQISPPSFSPSASASTSSHQPHAPVVKPQASTSTLSTTHNPGRRPSLVTTAQSILGDKLDDFTEKLAFIKKNIIMSMDNDDDEEEDGDSYNHYYNADRRISQEMYRKRAGSVGKSDEMSRTSRLSNNSSTSLLTPPPRSSSITQTHLGSKEEEEEEDEIFDKVVAISKNVRTFGEGVMGNGLRMFNNLSTRIKNAQQQQQLQQQQQQQQQHVELNNNNNNARF